MAGYITGKLDIILCSKKYQGSQDQPLLKWQMHGMKTCLPTVLSRYKLKDTYNGDEFGLLYLGLPKKTLHMKGEKCSGGKHSKLWLTAMAAASAAGEKLPIFVIGKSAEPICLKDVKSLPYPYQLQAKMWMNSFLFDEWAKEIDKKFEKENRKVILILDNCPVHQNGNKAKLKF